MHSRNLFGLVEKLSVFRDEINGRTRILTEGNGEK